MNPLRLSCLILLAGLFLTVSAYAHPVESCQAPSLQASGEWSTYELALGTTVVWQEPRADVVGWINDWQVVGTLAENGIGTLDYTPWDLDAGAWRPATRRDAVRFRSGDSRDLVEIAFQSRPDAESSFANYQRDLRTYNAQGYETSETRQNWIDSTQTWVDNRRVVYERNAAGTFTTLRFERFDGTSWSLDYRATTTFDAADNRVLCELFDTDDQGAAPYLRYRSSFDESGRLLAVVRDYQGQRGASVDSSALTYDAEGRYQALAVYRLDALSGEWTPSERSTATFDDAGQMVEIAFHSTPQGSTTMRPGSRNVYTYRPDGLFASATFQDWDAAMQQWSDRYRLLYTSELTTAGEAKPEGARLGISIGPNPASDRAFVRLRVPARVEVAVDLVDSVGRRVRSVHAGPVPAGMTTLPLDLRGLAPGLYLVRIQTSGGVTSRAVTVAR